MDPETDRVEGSLSVLLVEDNPGDARLIETYVDRIDPGLLPAEVALTHVEDLPTAFDRLESASFDLLLLDLGLPGSSGVETLTTVLDHVELIPVVVLSGLDDRDAAIAAIQQGAQDYLNKDNLDEESLGRTVRYAIERKKRERALRDRTRQLEVLTRIVRHDIANDVTIIDGLVEQVRETEPLTEEGQRRLQRVLRASDHATELIRTAREFVDSIVEEEEPELHPVALEVVLGEELEKTARTYEDATVEAGDLPGVEVRADEMLSSVFRNLLNNAVQHSDDGSPRIEVRTERDRDRVRVAVADDGPGIPDDRKADLFGKGAKGVQSGGTGIGLYLVDTLVDRYGGDVSVADSDLGGAEFVVELPVADGE